MRQCGSLEEQHGRLIQVETIVLCTNQLMEVKTGVKFIMDFPKESLVD